MATVKVPPSLKKSLVIQQLDITTWSDIWKSIDLDNIADSNFTHESVSNYIIESEAVDEQLYDALFKIHSLGDSAGRNLIDQAAEDVGIDIEMTDDESDQELVARLWIASREKKELLQVLARASAAFEFCSSSRNYKEYAGECGVQTDSFDKEEFKNLVSDWCTKNNKSGVVDIFIYSFDDTWCCDIVRGDPIKKVSVIQDEHQGVLSYKPAVQDHITIEPESGRIRILTNSTKLVQLYRETMGQVLKSSPDFFSTDNICTLDPLQKFGAKIFDVNYFPEIRRVTVSQLNWIRSGDSLLAKGRDCLKLLDELSARIEVAGQIVESKLRFDLAGESRPVFVTIKAPSEISVSKEEHEPLIFHYLDCIGLRGRFDIEQHKSFWEMEPWHYSETDWRKEIQGSFDRLKAQDCLKQVPLDYVHHPENNTGSGTMAVELDGLGNKIAVSEDLGLRSLTTTDVEGYKLDIFRLVSLVNRGVGLKCSAQEISSGLWRLGEIQLSGTEFVQLFFSASSQDVDVENVINKNSSGAKSVLILPQGCLFSTESVSTINVDVFNLYFDDLLSRIVDVLGLSRVADPAIWCGADLVINREKGLIWFEKNELSKLRKDTHAYKFVVMVAEGNGEDVSDDDIHKCLTCSTEDNPVRKAKLAFINVIKQELGLSGKDASKMLSDKLFKRRSQAWALNCSVRFIA